MKRIIKDKVYDTSTAGYIGEYSRMETDSKYWFKEELYRKRTGEYFIYGVGLSASTYDEVIDASSQGSEKITPISFENAKLWGKMHLDAEVYEREFGVNSDDEKVVGLHVQIPIGLNDKLEARRSSENKTKGEVVTEALEKHLRGEGK
ncbi:hypothetical protein [Peptoniphilus sp. HCN-40583]|uniref:hypothetical protein n=1 Tax=Peptoniphilus sp. HCN-40583 TaxID=3134662 RepID=UPI0030BA6648